MEHVRVVTMLKLMYLKVYIFMENFLFCILLSMHVHMYVDGLCFSWCSSGISMDQ